MSDITERLEFLAARAQTKISREFYRSVIAEIERLQKELDEACELGAEAMQQRDAVKAELRSLAATSIAAPFGRATFTSGGNG